MKFFLLLAAAALFAYSYLPHPPAISPEAFSAFFVR